MQYPTRNRFEETVNDMRFRIKVELREQIKRIIIDSADEIAQGMASLYVDVYMEKLLLSEKYRGKKLLHDNGAEQLFGFKLDMH